MRSTDHDASSLYINLVYAVIIVIFGGGILWSFAVPLEGAVHAEGVLVVNKYQREVQHFEGGIVKKIEVTEGQFVRQNDVLITLDDTVFRSQHNELLYKYYVASLSQDATEGLLDFDANIIALSIEDSFPLKGKIQEFYKLLQRKVDSDLRMYEQSLLGNDLSQRQAKLNLKIEMSNLELLKSDTQLLDDRLHKYKERDGS